MIWLNHEIWYKCLDCGKLFDLRMIDVRGSINCPHCKSTSVEQE